MKNAVLIILVVACTALAALDVVQQHKLQKQSLQISEASQQIGDLKNQVREKTDALDEARLAAQKAQILQQTLAQSSAEAVKESKKAAELQQSLAEAKTNNPLHSMAAMFKDPKMREMMKSQQKAYMGPVIDKEYGDLFKQLNLSPDQQAAFKDLIVKKALAGADVGFTMLDDSLDSSQRADLAKQAKTQTDAVDSEIKQFLGDDNYQAFQSYEKTVPDRMTVDQFSNQFAGTDNALTASQQEQLAQAMSDARNNFKWTSNLNQPNPGMNGDIAGTLTEDNINSFVQEREKFDQQFLTRAQQILSPAQMTVFEEFQKAQRDLQVAGLKMAAQMFKSQSQ